MSKQSFPEGKFMAPVKVGPKGQIVIPAEVREMLHISPGDTLLLLADREEGIAIPEQSKAQKIFSQIQGFLNMGVSSDEGNPNE